jgi:uncharacterized protein (DUF4213/DUF364 family)
LFNTIIENAWELFKSEKIIDNISIKKIVVGLGYTGLLLSDSSFGLSYTLIRSKDEKNQLDDYLLQNPIKKLNIRDILDLYNSKRPFFRCIGLAVLNAYSQVILPLNIAYSGSILDIIQELKPSTIGMVGNITSITDFLVNQNFQVRILDQFNLIPPTQQITPLTSVDELAHLDHAVISGSALIFDNLPQILEILTTIPGEKILVGPSAQLHPQIVFELGFTAVGGSQVLDISSTLQAISEGGNYRSFKQFTKKYCFHERYFP